MFSTSKKTKLTKIFFATDIHGSHLCFRKFIGAASFYKVDAVILGGDVTGKMIIPIVEHDDGTFRSLFQGQEYIMKSDYEVQELQINVKNQGFYSFLTNLEEIEELKSDKDKVDGLFVSLMKKTFVDWINFAEDKLRNTDTICYITGGNDDRQEVIDVFKETDHVKNPDNKVLLINGVHEMVSLGWGNPTPWATPRECSEEELRERIEKLVCEIHNFENCLFNFHIPPIDSTLDTAPQLDSSTYPPKVVIKAGQPVMAGAGSRAVRDAVEKYQPLLTLCGHVHESLGTCKIGRTLCINPGSDYGAGILKGVIVNLGDRRVVSYQFAAG